MQEDPHLEVADRLLQLSDRISTQVRALAIGIIAFGWSLFSADSASIKLLVQASKVSLLTILALAILALLLDFLQYVAGYKVANKVRLAIEDGTKHDAKYDYKSFLYRTQEFLFFSKQAVIAVSCGWLMFTVGTFIWKSL
jgi:hypothetical protein